MGWSNYGFPDPTMCANYKPAHGIYLAHKERIERAGLIYNDGVSLSLSGEFREPALLYPARNPDYVYSNDFYLSEDRRVFGGTIYLNQFIDPKQSYYDLFWNRDTLTEAVLARCPELEEYIPYETASHMGKTPSAYNKLSPTWRVLWAKQMYTQINLLKLCNHYEHLNLNLHIVMGRGEASGATSPIEAYNQAVSNFHIDDDWEYDVYHDSPGWSTEIVRYGTSWWCRLFRPLVIEPIYGGENLPETIQDCQMYLYGKPTTLTMSYLDYHGIGFSFSNTNIYDRINLPYYSSSVELPDAFKNGIYGPYRGFCTFWAGFAVIDSSPLFEFYDNVD
jgi:hypothetical protein